MTFNSRDEALLLWIAVALLWLLSKESTRKPLFNLSKAFLNWKVLLIFLLMITHVGIELAAFNKINLVDKCLIKDVIFWLFGSAFIILININKVNSDKKFFRKMIIDNLKLIVVVEFIINFYTFNFFIEIVLVPLIFFLMAMSIIAGMEKKLSLVKKIMDFSLTIVGIIIIVYAFIGLINHSRDLTTLDNIRSFILPPALTILYVPFIYFLALFMAYELLFVRLESLLHHNKGLIGVAKRKIIFFCNINLKKLNSFSNNCAKELIKTRDKRDLDKLFTSKNSFD